MIALPPFEAGAVQLATTRRVPGARPTRRGAPGAVEVLDGDGVATVKVVSVESPVFPDASVWDARAV